MCGQIHIIFYMIWQDGKYGSSPSKGCIEYTCNWSQALERKIVYTHDGFHSCISIFTLLVSFQYMYIIDGEDLTRLAKDYIKFLIGGKKSIRLSRAMYQWGRFYQRQTRKKEVQPDWLEREILNTRTWYDSPTKYKRLLMAYLASTSNEWSHVAMSLFLSILIWILEDNSRTIQCYYVSFSVE